MNWSVIIGVALFVILDLVVVGAVIAGVSQSAATSLRKFPPAVPAEDAEFRARQSLGIGLMNLGSSFDLAVDGAAIHIEPAWLGRLLRMPSASVPWERCRLVEKWTGATITIDGVAIRIPRWTVKTARGLGARFAGEA